MIKLLQLAFIAIIGLLNLASGRRVPHDIAYTKNTVSLSTTGPSLGLHENVLQVRQTYPEWKFEDGFEFYNFWLPNEESMVRAAFLGAIDLMETTMRVLSGTSGENMPSGENDPSFKRYFNPGDLNTFGAVIQRLLAVLGAPGTSAIRQCIEASKLQLIYGDGPSDEPGKPFSTNCERNGATTWAYYNSYTDKNKVIRSYISFCPLFFSKYKLQMRNPTTPAIPFVNRSKFTPWVDNEGLSELPEVESGPAILMHELLHWYDVTNPVIEYQIVDTRLERPDDKSRPRAYRSFYSMKVKDPAWKAEEGPLRNADSYVYTVLEIYYRFKYGLQAWQDSPDPKGAPASPNIPPGGPLNSNPPRD